MSAVADLLVAIAAAPDDDEPRLVWADAVGGERGELVVLQCRLAREDLPRAEHRLLAARVDVLLAQHGAAWSGFAGERAVSRCMFRRGFVEAVEARVAELPWPRIFDTAPLVTGLEITGLTQLVDHRAAARGVAHDPIAFVSGMFEQPAFERLRAIGFDGVARYEVIGDDEWDNEWTSRADELLELIARTGRLAGFRALAIRDPFTQRGMFELLASNALASLERLVLEDGEVDVAQARALMASLPSIRALDLGTAIRLHDIADVIPPSVIELHVRHHADSFELAKLACAPSLERVSLPRGNAAIALPRLRSLEVTHGTVIAEGVYEARAVDRRAKLLVHAGIRTREPWPDYGLVTLHR